MEEVEQVICNLMETEFARFKQSCQGGMVNRNAVYETNKGAVFVKLSDRPQVNNSPVVYVCGNNVTQCAHLQNCWVINAIFKNYSLSYEIRKVL